VPIVKANQNKRLAWSVTVRCRHCVDAATEALTGTVCRDHKRILCNGMTTLRLEVPFATTGECVGARGGFSTKIHFFPFGKSGYGLKMLVL
jgi:hypothetical protein